MMNGSHRRRGAPAAVALGVVVIAVTGFAPAVPAAVARSARRAGDERSGVAVVRPLRLTELAAVSGAPRAFQEALRDAFTNAGVDVAPLGDTNKLFRPISNKDVQQVLAGGTVDEPTLHAIRKAGKQLGVAAVLVAGAESYSYDVATGTVEASIRVGVLDAGGAILGDDVVSASANGGDGPGARRTAFDAVSVDLAKRIADATKGFIGGTDDGQSI